MRFLLAMLLLCLFTTYTASAKTPPYLLLADTGLNKIAFINTIDVKGATVGELRSRARKWFASGHSQTDYIPSTHALLKDSLSAQSYMVHNWIKNNKRHETLIVWNIEYTVLIAVKDQQVVFETKDFLLSCTNNNIKMPMQIINGRLISEHLSAPVKEMSKIENDRLVSDLSFQISNTWRSAKAAFLSTN